MNETNEPIRRWTTFTKRSVVLMLLVLLGMTLYRFRNVIPPLMIAFLVAFILHSIVGFISSRLRISHGSATNIVFLVLITMMLGAVVAPVSAIPSIQEIVDFVENDLSNIITEIDTFLSEPVQIWQYSLDLSTISDDLVGAIQSFVSSVAEGTVDIVRNVASGIFWLIIILTVAFYLVKDAARFAEQFDDLAPPDYREDMVHIRHQITDVWNAFLRGQLVMGLAMVVLTTVVCAIVGLPYALVLGLIAGVTEFIPNVGPIIALIPAVLVALFKGSTVFVEMNPLGFAGLVLLLYLIIQQIEGNVLLPRIMGESLNLHPLIVLIGIIVGGNMAGIVGMLLAAPVLATLRVASNYIFCRLYDRDPFAEPEGEAEPPPPGVIVRACKATLNRVQAKVQERREQAKLRKQVQIRLAQTTDKPAVEAVSAQIWEGDDYIPQVWDAWLADPHGELIVAELVGQIVGIAKLSRLADDEWWMEGLRVAPAYRGRGISSKLHAHLVEKAREVGQGTLRFGTSSENESVRHIATRDGFCHLATCQRYRADSVPITDAPPLRQLDKTNLEIAWELIPNTPRYEASGGLYEDHWTWKNLTRERLADHLTSGDVWGLYVDEKLSALALVCWVGDGAVSIGHVDGGEGTLPTILKGLRGLATQLDCVEVRLKPVNEPTLIAAVETAGYERQDKELEIFELQL
ncbi:MAG: AI-2E family transporter [Chloroflexi bacterium]|nr:AI-2E family transporter [Chloroflexota bacterium]